ncbi:serine/threonine protein kinase, partial [Myxococcota bacterium]|nr:serine/threonine protein kinase [Myxococcota bacterium]
MSEELLPGMLVGRYQLMFRLGKGGMGEVWAASTNVAELGFQKLIALKVLRSAEMTSNAAIMFLDEARAAAVLQHAAIVPTVDLGKDGDLLFLAMDMVRGPSLTALLQKLVINKAMMSPAVVAHVGIQIAAALDYANGRASFQGKPLKLIHRDVSPHNVLLDTHGAVRLTDFGVARTTIQNHESHVGTVRGKPSYMAPEQVVGGDIDARTDLFSLGIVLYESASLKRLFGRSNPVKSMDAVLKHQPKPLVELVPGFPPALWAVIEKALAKDPAERWQNAAEFGTALSEALHTLDGASGAQRELAKLITDNFPADAFAIEARVKEVEHLSASVAAAAVQAPARATSVARADGTRAMRPRSASSVA